jgi:actin-like ATPase involved in cell morphogenesis
MGKAGEESITIVEQVVEKLRDLPPEKQKGVLDFAESLRGKNATGNPRRSLRGLCKHLNVEIAEEDIAEARREMGGNFRRDIEL